MTEEKERLSKTEYDKVGEMLLELIAECPHVPQSVKNVPQGQGILIDSTGSGIGLFILTDGGLSMPALWWRPFCCALFITSFFFTFLQIPS